MQALVPPHRCYIKWEDSFVTVFLLREGKNCEYCWRESASDRLQSQDLCFITLYLFTCYISIDTFTIFTVTSWEEFLWARHAIFFMTSYKNGYAGSLRGGLSCLGGGRDQVAKPQDKPVRQRVLKKHSSSVLLGSSIWVPKPNTIDSSQATSQEAVFTAAALDWIL